MFGLGKLAAFGGAPGPDGEGLMIALCAAAVLAVYVFFRETPSRRAAATAADVFPAVPFADGSRPALLLREEPLSGPAYAPQAAGSPGAAEEGDADPAPPQQPHYRNGRRKNLSFTAKMAAAKPQMREMYAALRAQLLACTGMKSRISHGWDTFKYQKRKVVAKFSMAGQYMVVHLALDPAAYAHAKVSVEDMGEVSLYASTPLAVKVRGGNTFKFVRRLIGDLARQEGMQERIT